MRLRLIQIPAAPSLGVYPTYRTAAAVQELVRRQFLDAKLTASSSGLTSSSLSSSAPPPPPTVISFTPSPTFTLGRRQHASDVGATDMARLRAPLTVVTRDEDAEKDIAESHDFDPEDHGHGRRGHDTYTFHPAVHSSPRGGLTTYHGPGQAVLWPVFDLKSPLHRHFTVRCYSRLLEDTTADVLRRRFGVDAHTTADPGLWVGGSEGEGVGEGQGGELRKIAALGVHLRRNISALGVAVNLDTPVTRGQGGPSDKPAQSAQSTNPWLRFVPCGLDGKGVTCVAEEGRRRFGHIPASWSLQPAPFAAKWAAALAARLGLEAGVDVADDAAVRQLLEQASRNVVLQGQEEEAE